jgi:ABC-type uncharacterized transport system auxiliary subunit
MRMKNAAALILLLFSCACAPLQSEKPADSIYQLQARHEETKSCNGRTGIVVAVPKPELPAGFDTDQIAVYLEGGQRMDYAAHARWADNLTDMMQSFIITALQQDCGMVVQAPRFDIPSDYRLIIKFYDVEPVYNDSAQNIPVLKVSASFTLTRYPDGERLSEFTLSKSRRAEKNSLTNIAAGLESLLQELLREAREKLKPVMPREL